MLEYRRCAGGRPSAAVTCEVFRLLSFVRSPPARPARSPGYHPCTTAQSRMWHMPIHTHHTPPAALPMHTHSLAPVLVHACGAHSSAVGFASQARSCIDRHSIRCSLHWVAQCSAIFVHYIAHHPTPAPIHLSPDPTVSFLPHRPRCSCSSVRLKASTAMHIYSDLFECI